MDRKTCSRYPWVDCLKGIGILLVVYGHVARGVFAAGIDVDRELFQMVDSIIYSFHMPLFFFISGLFFYRSLDKQGSLDLVSRKMDTLLYPYVVWSLLQGSVEFAFSRYTNSEVSLFQVANLLAPRAHFWFLYALFFIMVLGSMIYSSVRPAYFLGVVLVFSLIFIFESHLPDRYNAGLVLHYFVFFALGVWFNQVRQWVLENSRILLLPMLALFAFGQWLFHGYFGLTYQDGGPGLLALSLVSILFMVLLARELSRYPVGLLMQIGYLSLPIYLMHVLAGSGIRVVLQNVLQVFDPYLHLLAGIGFAVLLPMLLMQAFRKWNLLFLVEAPKKISVHRWYREKFE